MFGIGIGELILLVVILLAGGGLVSRAARWLLFRRAPGAEKLLGPLFGWVDEEDTTDPDQDPPPSAPQDR